MSTTITPLSLLSILFKRTSSKSAPKHTHVYSTLPLPTDNHEAWKGYWRAQGHSWRTEPEIDEKRRKYLTERRIIPSNIKQGIYPFKGVKLSRADVEWLLATHANGLGPVYWSDEDQLSREGLDLRGANLANVNLRFLPLAGIRGGLTFDAWQRATLQQRADACIHLEGADLKWTHLEGANLNGAHLEGANPNIAYMKRCSLHWACLEGACLVGAHLESADLGEAHLEGANLNLAHLEDANLYATHFEGKTMSSEGLEQIRKYISDFPATLPPAILSAVFFDSATNLRSPVLGDEKHGCVRFADVSWGNVNLALVDWSQITMLGEEKSAQQKKRDYQVPWGPLWSVSDEEKSARQKKYDGGVKQRSERLREYEGAVRANRQLAIALQSQGLNEEATRFVYRAQVLQKHVFWFQMLQKGAKLKQRFRVLGAWLFSWFLYLLAGYGYRLGRSFLAYLLVISLFMILYHVLDPHLAWSEAFVVSMTAFHGRGFSPSTFVPGDPLSFASAAEAFVGLIVEVTFIATLTQRFFNR